MDAAILMGISTGDTLPQMRSCSLYQNGSVTNQTKI